MITLLAIRKFLSSVFAFALDNWRWLLPLIAGLLLWWYVGHLQDQRDAERAEVAAIHGQIRLAADQRRQQNERKAIEDRAEQRVVMAAHTSQIQTLRRQYDTRNHTDQARADDRIDSWRQRVRLEVARNAAGLPPLPESTETTAESGGDCHATAARQEYDTLELACAVTTADYNALHESWDKACGVYGCVPAE